MKNTPTSSPSVQSQDLEVAKNNINSLPLSGGTGYAEDNPLGSPAGGAEETTGETVGETTGEDARKDAEESPGNNAEGGAQNSGREGAREYPEKGAKDESPPVPTPEVHPIQKEKTVPASIRLWKSAYDALRILMGKYGMNMVDMASMAIIAYAKQAAAAPIVRYRMMDDKTLFALQAAATDIRKGLSNLRNDLYEARKSKRDPEERNALYTMLSVKYQTLLKHADATLTLCDKECLLHDLLEPSDHAQLIKAVDRLGREKPKNQTQRQLMELHLKIYKILLP